MWIDAANMPHDENNWKTFADEALKNGKCRVLILFRSEISLSKRTIKDEWKHSIRWTGQSIIL